MVSNAYSSDPNSGSPRPQHRMRRYEVAYLTDSGEIEERTQLAPATPAFEQAFGVIARGAVLSTDRGLLAIEDILPGDTVRTVDNGPQKILWKGGMTVVPNNQGGPADLVRVASDALGMGSPMPDLVLGRHAHIFSTNDAVRRRLNRPGAFVPIVDYVDGVNVMEITPMTPVRLYQLAFEGHERVAVNGVQVESLHPGPAHLLKLPKDMQPLFMSLFPFRKSVTDFGLMRFPRLFPGDLEMIRAA